MEKIKATEVLKDFKYLAIDKDGCKRIFSRKPSIVGDEFRIEGFNPRIDRVCTISNVYVDDNWEESLREIDFSEDFTEERLTPMLPPVKDETQDPKIYSFSGNADELRAYFKSLDLEKEAPTKEPSPIFKIDDTVHVLSCSNLGEFGKSTEGIIKTIYKDGTILVKVDEGVEEVHDEYHVSFTPFSIREAGFSQVRPVREPMVGDWGFFYDAKNPYWFTYSELGAIKKNTSNDTLYFAECGGCYLRFSHTPPQLAEGIPNPFTKC